MLTNDELDIISARVAAATGPSRELDALITLAVAGYKVNHRVAVVMSILSEGGPSSQPLCLISKTEMPERVRRGLEERAVGLDAVEFLYFNWLGNWYQFVARCVPPVTADIQAGIRLLEEHDPQWRHWSIDSDGHVRLGTSARAVPDISEQNTIPALALAAAILKTQYSKAPKGNAAAFSQHQHDDRELQAVGSPA